MQYYFSLDGTSQKGPLDAVLLRQAGVGPTTMVWREGLADWQPAGRIPELAALFAAAMPPRETSSRVSQPVGSPREPFAPLSPDSTQPPVHQGTIALPSEGLMASYATPGGGPPLTGTNGLGIASLILGIFGLTSFCCFYTVLASVLAIIFGHIARSQIRRGYGTGGPIALVGLILGYLGLALIFLGIHLLTSTNGLHSTPVRLTP